MKRNIMLLGAGILLLSSMFTALVPSVVEGKAPRLINCSGILRDGGGNPVPNGSYSVAFKIYDGPGGGAVTLWTETQSVATLGGLFTVLLGSVTALPVTVFHDTTRYLGITVSPDPEMSPRTRLVSVGYAIESDPWNSDQDSNLFRLNGSVGIGGFPSPTNKLAVRNAGSSSFAMVGISSNANNSGSGNAYGGVYDAITYGTGSPYGVYSSVTSTTASSPAYGFFTEAENFAEGTAYGIYCHAGKIISGAISGTSYGGYFIGQSNVVGASAYGVYGSTNSQRGPSYGVYGTGFSATSGSNPSYGGHFSGTATGDGANGYGVYGVGSSSLGLSYGVYGDGGYAGVYGTGANAGVYGGGGSFGVFGTATNSGGFGVFGSNNGNSTIWAGYFAGDSRVTGNLSVDGFIFKNGGGFKIDHPTDPANKYLYHSFVESPDMKNIYDGVVTTDAKGEATVTLPDWFGSVNKDFRYQLTAIGQFAQAIVSREISDNRFSIQTDKPNVKISWQVTGIRKDAYAEAHRIPVEEAKSGGERGKYLQPEAHGVPASLGMHYEQEQKMAAERKQMEEQQAKMEAERKQHEEERTKMEQQRVIQEQKVRGNK